MALYDASPLKRKLLGLPDPGAAPDLPDLIGLGQQTMNAQMGSVTSDSGTNHQPRPTLGSRIRGALGQYGPGVAAGLVSSMDPNAGGLSAFASAAGRGFLGVEGARQQQAQEAQGAEDRMLRNDELRARIQALTTKTVNPNVILPRGGQLVSPDGRMLADNPEGPNAGMMPDWQKQGYPSFDAWRRDRLAISRAGSGDPTKGQVTPAALFEQKTRLMSPHWGPDATGAIKLMPGLSAEEADRVVSQAAGTYQAPPAASTFGGGLAQPGTPSSRPQGRRSAAAPVPAPAPMASTPQDRWEELVAQGTDKDAATAQVKQEFGLP